MKRAFAIALLCLALAGCATTQRMNTLSLGMSKQDVIATMGTPASTRASGESEYLIYNLLVIGQGRAPHFVRLVDGRVDAYGMVGDFGSTQQTQKVDATVEVRQR